MYCKHCGKQIADDSKFCQYCGGRQDEDNPTPIHPEVKPEESTKEEKVIEIPKVKTNLSDKAKKWLSIYFAWALLNLIFILIKGDYGNASGYFFPFQSTYSSGKNSWDLKYYDISEFLVYAILIPLLIYTYIRYKAKKNNEGSNQPDNNNNTEA